MMMNGSYELLWKIRENKIKWWIKKRAILGTGEHLQEHPKTYQRALIWCQDQLSQFRLKFWLIEKEGDESVSGRVWPRQSRVSKNNEQKGIIECPIYVQSVVAFLNLHFEFGWSLTRNTVALGTRSSL